METVVAGLGHYGSIITINAHIKTIQIECIYIYIYLYLKDSVGRSGCDLLWMHLNPGMLLRIDSGCALRVRSSKWRDCLKGHGKYVSWFRG